MKNYTISQIGEAVIGATIFSVCSLLFLTAICSFVNWELPLLWKGAGTTVIYFILFWLFLPEKV